MHLDLILPHSFLLNDPSKRAFVKVDGKPVPVLLTRQEGQRRVTGSIKGVPGQTFEVAFWDGTKKSMHGRKVSLFFGKQWCVFSVLSSKTGLTILPQGRRFALLGQ